MKPWLDACCELPTKTENFNLLSATNNYQLTTNNCYKKSYRRR